MATTHGMAYSPEYKAWGAIKERCLNKNSKLYRRYGGRGIKICKQWTNSFKSFYADMGDRPSPKHSIDRKDNDGNYEPDNCQWSTVITQRNNTSRNVFMTFLGERKTRAQWARKIGMPYSRLEKRMRTGWSTKDALTRPYKSRVRIE